MLHSVASQRTHQYPTSFNGRFVLVVSRWWRADFVHQKLTFCIRSMAKPFSWPTQPTMHFQSSSYHHRSISLFVLFKCNKNASNNSAAKKLLWICILLKQRWSVGAFNLIQAKDVIIVKKIATTRIWNESDERSSPVNNSWRNQKF